MINNPQDTDLVLGRAATPNKGDVILGSKTNFKPEHLVNLDGIIAVIKSQPQAINDELDRLLISIRFDKANGIIASARTEPGVVRLNNGCENGYYKMQKLLKFLKDLSPEDVSLSLAARDKYIWDLISEFESRS